MAYLTDYLRAQLDALTGAEPGVLAGDPEAVHDMRVAVRRLRATLSTFTPLLGDARMPTDSPIVGDAQDRVAMVRDELRWLGGLLGTVRDHDVLAHQLSSAVAAEPSELVVGPVAARIRQRLAADASARRRDLDKALSGPRYGAILVALATLIESLPRRTRKRGVERRRLRKLVGRSLRRADRRLDEAESLAGTDRDLALHEARKAYKRARYAVEVIAPGTRRPARRPARRLVERLTALQDLLGAHQDTVVAEQVLRDYGMRAYLDGENAFTYGLLHARQHAVGERELAAVDAARRRAHAASSWLR